MKKVLSLLVVTGVVLGVGYLVFQRIQADQNKAESGKKERAPAPIEVADVIKGPITWQRTYSGTLEATSEITIAPRISGRIADLRVNLADEVKRGQELALLDDAEYVQAVLEAAAELKVAEANLSAASKSLEITDRALKNFTKLHADKVASDAELDSARADHLSSQGDFEVATAQLTRAQASLEAAKVRKSYTRIVATWEGGQDTRVVSMRHAETGDTLSANSPLVTIVELNPITAVFYITEREYSLLRNNQHVTLATDAFPGIAFDGAIQRISPVFRQNSRQARVEVQIANEDRRLKPGMFVRITLDLEHIEDAITVHRQAITRRADKTGVFAVTSGGDRVRWIPVRTGIEQGDMVQVLESELQAGWRVAVLGLQMLDDNAKVTLVFDKDSAFSAVAPGAVGSSGKGA